MVSKLPAQSAHLVKLAPSGQVAVAVVSDLQGSHSSSLRRRLNSLLLANELGTYIRHLLAHLARKVCTYFRTGLWATYKDVAMSPVLAQKLAAVGRKTLILDLDETLVHSCYLDPDTHDNIGCNQMPDDAKPDYELNVTIDGIEPIHFRVFKRPQPRGVCSSGSGPS
ncbi:CTD nuclear envelope phosphatase 1 isoform X2 [Drosophila eugracilis]|uniref:CTD nuclear envelope phosphatase 1 isoform X2 n=1 Tax=Drosophila eugracilis TaxID=29029 RepID=UPI0007E6F5F3|nr:CTD nuclear envelope phosphatase 1 isoform X2 [Drosophila eugracilis]